MNTEMVSKVGIIRKTGPKKWCLYSKKKGPGGNRRNLGCYGSLEGIKKRERQVQFFKRSDSILNTFLPDLQITQIVRYLNRTASIVEKHPELKVDFDYVNEILGSTSKKELRKWLEMTSQDVKALNNIKLYKILAEIIPDIDELSKQLGDLEYILNMLKEHKILPLISKYDSKVLQFKEILVAAITAPRTDPWAVIKVLEKRHPELRREIEKIKKAKTTITTRLVKTTVDKLEAGNRSKFPTSIPPRKVLSSKTDKLIKNAGLVGALQTLIRRFKGDISHIWEAIKSKFSGLLESLVDSINGVLGTFDSMSNELRSLL